MWRVALKLRKPKMVSRFRAYTWSFLFAMLFHLDMSEHHSVLLSLLEAGFWTAVADMFISGAIRSMEQR